MFMIFLFYLHVQRLGWLYMEKKMKIVTGEFNKTDTRTANRILAGPTSGSAAAPTFRALVAADLLKLNEFTAPDGSVSLNSQKITNLATPTADGDAASKSIELQILILNQKFVLYEKLFHLVNLFL